jgi:hypothetical protein
VIGFGLLVGHLLGDYVLQNDWMARLKTAQHPGRAPDPKESVSAGMPDAAHAFKLGQWTERTQDARMGTWACLIHCLLYTLAVWACSFWWMPLWGLAVCFAVHFPVDRWRLARRWMMVVGQKDFATGPLSPWSVIVVDNTFHLLTLFVIAAIALYLHG